MRSKADRLGMAGKTEVARPDVETEVWRLRRVSCFWFERVVAFAERAGKLHREAGVSSSLWVASIDAVYWGGLPLLHSGAQVSFLRGCEIHHAVVS